MYVFNVFEHGYRIGYLFKMIRFVMIWKGIYALKLG